MPLLAWTAAYTILIAGGIILLLIALRLTAVFVAMDSTRWIWDVLLAIIGLVLTLLLF